MFKKILLLAVAPLALLATSAMASDDVLDQVANLDVTSISDAKISIDDGLASLDIDGLSEQAGSEKGEQAIEACFRRFGYGSYGGYGGYCGYNYGCYSPWYSYSHCYYQPILTYRPVYYTTYCYPTFSYWGCY
jgi:hypothetical protein